MKRPINSQYAGRPGAYQAAYKSWRTHTLKLGQMVCDLIEAHLTPDQFKLVQNGENPHDMIDANIASYGAFAALTFDDFDAGREDHCDLINAAWDVCGEFKWNRDSIRNARNTWE